MGPHAPWAPSDAIAHISGLQFIESDLATVYLALLPPPSFTPVFLHKLNASSWGSRPRFLIQLLFWTVITRTDVSVVMFLRAERSWPCL